MPSYRFDTDQPVDLTVRIPAGEIRLVAGDTATSEVDVECPDDPQYAERVVVQLSARRDRPALVVAAPREGGLLARLVEHSDKVLVTVRVPTGSSVDAQTASADLSAEGSWESARVTTASGDVRVDTVGHDVSLRTASGEVSVQSADGPVAVKTASGDVQLHDLRCGAQVATASGDVRVGCSLGRLSVKTASGDVLVRACGDVRAHTSTGDVRLDRVESGDVVVQTVSGDVCVAVPLGTLVRVDAQTVGGQLGSEIELDPDPTPDVSAEAATAAVQVTARTVSGDVQIRRAYRSDAA